MYKSVDFCETCLSTGRRMCDIDEGQLQSICPGFQLSVTQRCVCWECWAMIDKWDKFRDRVMKAQEILADFSVQNYNTLSSLKVIKQENLSISSRDMWKMKDENPHLVELVDPSLYIKEESQIQYETPLESLHKEDPIVCEEVDNSTKRKRKTIALAVVQETSEKDNASNTITYALRSRKTSCIKTNTEKHKPNEKRVEFSNNIDVAVISNTDDAVKNTDDDAVNNTDDAVINNEDSSEETETADEFENEVTNEEEKEKVLFRTVRVGKEKLIRLMTRARKKHNFIHTKLFKCNSCVVMFKNEQNYKQHMKKHETSAGPYVCEICKLRFKTPEYVSTHEQAHFDKIMECVECREQFVAAWDFSSHYNYYHAYRDIMCWKCIVRFPTRKQYSAHRRVHHKINRTFTCDHCGKHLCTKSSLLHHIQTFHSTNQVTTQCPICFRVCKGDWKHVQQRHMKKHLPLINDENCFCVECNVQYSSEAIYQRHIKEKHEGETRSECPHCGKFVVHLRSHLLVHTSDTKHSCPECNKQFRWLSGLRNHVKYVHRREPKPRTNACRFCPKSFHNKQELRNHTNTHTGERPYVCATCGDTFGHQAALYNHNKLKHRKNTKNTS